MKTVLTVVANKEVLGRKFNFYGSVESPLFLAKDIAEMLGMTNVTDMVSRVDEDEVTKFNLGSRSGEAWFLTEQGLYEVCMMSRKPVAKEMKREIKSILKELRLNGVVIAESATDAQIIEGVRKHYASKYCTDDIHDRKSVRAYIRQSDLMQLEETVQNIINIVVPMKGSIKNEIIDCAIKELKKMDADRMMDSPKNTFIKTVAKDLVIVLQDVKIGKKVRRISTLQNKVSA